DVRRLLVGNLSPAEQNISPWPGRQSSSSSSSSSSSVQGGYSLWPAYWLSNTAAAAAVQLLQQLQRRQHQQQTEAECALTAKICSSLAELHEPLETGSDEAVLQELCTGAAGDLFGFNARLCSTQLLQQQQVLLQHRLVALQQKAVELAELLQQQQQQQQQHPRKRQKQQGDSQVLHALQQQISNSQEAYGRLAPLYLIISNELHQVSSKP
ncbi:hypothetical protein ETH_00036140, partial [Eimeria tenella]